MKVTFVCKIKCKTTAKCQTIAYGMSEFSNYMDRAPMWCNEASWQMIAENKMSEFTKQKQGARWPTSR